MTYDVRLLDLADDAELERAHDLVTEADLHGRPHATASSLTERLAHWRDEDPGERIVLHGAFDGAQLVGVNLSFWPMSDNTSKVWTSAYVATGHRRRGIGSALVSHVAHLAHEEGRSELLAEADVPPTTVQTHPNYLFCLANGFEFASTEVMRRVSLPIDDSVLDSLARDAQARHGADYDLVTFVGGAPAHLRESLFEAMNRLMVDAPFGTLEFEPETIDGERYQHWIDVEAGIGRTRVSTLAVHRTTGTVAAYTEVKLPASTPERVWQSGTLVRGDHRGHRLGMAVKVATIRYLQEQHPERTMISTHNDEANIWMVAINEALGFRILEHCIAFKREL